jgi:classical protein kinase C/novel protein kinase C epsilon type
MKLISNGGSVTEFLPDGQRKENLRKPLAGKLSISLKMARDLNHVPLSRKSSKVYNETTIVIKIEGNERAVSHPSRNDRWHEDFDIMIDKANEVEFTIYDTQTGGDPAPIGMLWLRINDIVEALRRQKVGMDGQGGAPAGWVTAATATSMRGPMGGNADATLHGEQNKIEVPMTYGKDGKSTEGIDGWFAVEPAGALSLHLDFGECVMCKSLIVPAR